MFRDAIISYSFPVFFLLMSGIFSILSLSAFGGFAFERTFFKSLTFLFILLAFFSSMLSSKKLVSCDVAYIFSFGFIFFILFLCDFMNQPDKSFISLFRFVSASLLIVVLFSLSVFELKALLSSFFVFAVLVAIISIIFFLLGIDGLERFPLLGWYSNKSIFFEQNVFGIYIYLVMVALLYFSRLDFVSLLVFCILFLAVLMSFYRTVYGLTLVVIILQLPHLMKFFLGSFFAIFAAYNFDAIYEVLKFEQLITLTGRTELWNIGLVGFVDRPFIGFGESSIPDFSNRFLHRNPPFTTFHNVFIDVVFSSGILGIFSFVIFLLVSLFLVGRKHFLFFLLLLAPSFFNTFFPFSPNILGLFVGALMLLLHRDATLLQKKG